MKSIADEESKKYQSHFSEYIKKNIAGDDMEALYKKCMMNYTLKFC
uniref:Uncharacterized protein n=1 Tax=Aegilops tauschii subsp. strangulata TaxID=200361 RepID=A0A453M0K2_AEGTS